MDIKKIRKQLNLSQEEFGKKIGVTRQTIINYEKGDIIPDSKIDILSKLIDSSNPDVKENLTILSEPEVVYSSTVNKDQYIKSLERTIEIQSNNIKILEEMIEMLRNFNKQIK